MGITSLQAASVSGRRAQQAYAWLKVCCGIFSADRLEMAEGERVREEMGLSHLIMAGLEDRTRMNQSVPCRWCEYEQAEALG